MFASADILIHNVLGLGSALVVVLLAAFAVSRLAFAALGPLLRRLDPSGALYTRSRGQFSRFIILATTLLSLLLLGGAFLLTWYEQDVGVYAQRWALALLDDPAAVGWAIAELFAVLLAALASYLVLSGLLRVLAEGLGRLLDRARYGAQLDLLASRLRIALRWTLVLGVVLYAVGLTPAAESLRYPLTVLTYFVVGFAVARALVASSHLLLDVLLHVTQAGAEKSALSLYFSRLGRLIPVTKKVVDYFFYVGTATVVFEQLTPDTPIAQLGLMVLRVIGILYISRVIVEVGALAIREALSPGESETDAATQHQRATLIPVATSLTRYVTYIIGIAMALNELGLDTTPLLAGAGLIGIAVGLGAQAIVSDLVSGFFILFEGLFLVGHRISLGEVNGFVEEIGVRVTKVRDNAGMLHCIPNGEIRAVATCSHVYVNSIVEFCLPYELDLPRALSMIKDHFAAARQNYSDILGETELVIEALPSQHIVVRAVTRVKPGKDDEMNEALRIEVVAALAAAKIAPPHERRLVALAGGTIPGETISGETIPVVASE